MMPAVGGLLVVGRAAAASLYSPLYVLPLATAPLSLAFSFAR